MQGGPSPTESVLSSLGEEMAGAWVRQVVLAKRPWHLCLHQVHSSACTGPEVSGNFTVPFSVETKVRAWAT